MGEERISTVNLFRFANLLILASKNLSPISKNTTFYSLPFNNATQFIFIFFSEGIVL